MSLEQTVTETDPARVVLSVQNLGKTYGTGATAKRAIHDLTFDVHHGELLCIVGQSGAGKTTLLKCLAGLLKPSSGVLEIDSIPITEPPEQLGLVFQDYSRSLLPWMTVLGNVSLPLRGKHGLTKAESKNRSLEMLHAVGLEENVASYPWQLSGGMQQRVAIARGLAYQPEVLIMDEPFASVDAQTRMELEDLVLSLRTSFNLTVVFVTHDIDEAIYLSDRVLVLSSSPATVVADIPVCLPSPRDQVATKGEPEFVRLRGDILTKILNS